MKILFITENLAPFRVKWLDAVAEYCQVKIMYLGHYESSVNEKYRDHKPEKAIATHAGYKIGNIFLYNYRKILKEKADILVVDGYGFLAQVLLILLLKYAHRPFVLTVDGGFMPEVESKIKFELKKRIISSAAAYLSTCRSMDKILCHYGANANCIYRHHFSSVHIGDVITNPLTDQEKKELRKSLLGKDFDKMIVSVGKMIHGKGFDILINAMADRRLEDAHLFLIGGNPPEEYKNLCISLGILDRVHFLDFMKEEELKQYYMAADVFALMTRRDVWGLVIGEAMACGLPIVTTNMCMAGVEMLPKECIVENENVLSAAQIISHILSDYDYRMHLSKKNLETIRPYSMELAAQEDVISIKTIVEEINGK